MRRLIFTFVALIIMICTASAATICRTFWGCELGVNTQQEAADTIKKQFIKDAIVPKIDGDYVIVNSVWLYGYQFDETKLKFTNNKLKSIVLTRNFFGLDQTDSFLKEASQQFIDQNLITIKDGLISGRDPSTYVRLAQIETDDGYAEVKILITDLNE